MSGKVGYVAVSGGFDLQPIMGSYSTYLRGGFGGIGGNRLLKNMALPIAQGNFKDGPDKHFSSPPKLEDLGLKTTSKNALPTTIRVILGPQEDYFTEAARNDFLTGPYTVSRESDRMGSRLEGPVLVHHPDKNPEIISDGIVPGAIQVPGNGAPIVLLVDGPTVGGYPKIATVITADLPKFSVLPPGSQLIFEDVNPEVADALLRTQRAALEGLLATIEALQFSEAAMYKTTLVSGVMNAFEPPE